jgi:hypothetical protein
MTVQRVQTPEQRRTRQVTAGPNRRIVAVAAIIVAQLWGLVTALQAFLAGHDAEVAWILGFELVAVAAALIIARGGRDSRRQARHPAVTARRVGGELTP